MRERSSNAKYHHTSTLLNVTHIFIWNYDIRCRWIIDRDIKTRSSTCRGSHGKLVLWLNERNEVFNWRGIGATRVQMYKSIVRFTCFELLVVSLLKGCWENNPICDTLLFHVDNWIEKMCLRCNLIDANIIFPLSCRLAHTSLGFDVLWEWSGANWSGNHLYQMILFTDRIWLVWHSSEQVKFVNVNM